MANRTISLSPVCDLIRKELVKSGTPFSLFVQDALIEWNRTTRKLDQAAEVDEKPKVPWYYECQLCKQKGHHASNCSMYNPVIESEGESNA
jgi:hypothetical protein